MTTLTATNRTSARMMDAMPLLSETSNATEALVSKAALTLFMARPIPAHSAGVGIWLSLIHI